MQFTAKDCQLCPAVFAGLGLGDSPAERLRHSLKTITNPEHRQTEVKQRWIEPGSTFSVDTGRSTRKHNRQRITGGDLLDRGGVRNYLGKNPCFSNPAGDKLRILRTEVDH